MKAMLERAASHAETVWPRCGLAADRAAWGLYVDQDHAVDASFARGELVAPRARGAGTAGTTPATHSGAAAGPVTRWARLSRGAAQAVGAGMGAAAVRLCWLGAPLTGPGAVDGTASAKGGQADAPAAAA